jgi:polyisoprenyl-teichoic acid--peptidoglycan teichoic acid transferase
MTGPGPLDDWAGWGAPTRPARRAQPPTSPGGLSATPTLPPLPRRQTPRPSDDRGPWTPGTARPYPADTAGHATAQAGRRAIGGGPGEPSGPSRSRTAPLPGPRRRGRTWLRVAGLALLVTLIVAVVLGAVAAHRIYAFGQAISTQNPLSTQTGYMMGLGRVNLLVLGYGGAGHDGAYLTDSMLVISMIPGSGSTTLISVPRDLWVEVPPGSGQYAKINTAYQYGLSNGYDGMPPGRLAAGALAVQQVSAVTGLSISNWMAVNFTGFRKLVDTLGGVDITVPTAFTARYPVNDDPSVNASWKTIHFNTGRQHMDGERAIEYARARYVLDPLSEGTDFARSARQQLLVRAIMARARQVSAWTKLASAADALQGAMYTNLSLADLGLMGEKMDLSHAHRIGLTNQNVLQDAQSNDGQDILVPTNSDWGAVQQYVASQLKP